jgi:hypothetical protein
MNYFGIQGINALREEGWSMIFQLLRHATAVIS